MSEEKKTFWDRWGRELMMSFVGTTLSILLTFGSSALQKHFEDKAAQRNTALMAILDIDESVRQLKTFIDETDKGFQACRCVLNQIEQIDTLPMQTLGDAFEFLVELDSLKFVSSKERLFLGSEQSVSNINNVAFVNNMERFYAGRHQLELTASRNAQWRKPISAQEFYQISLNSPGDNSIDLRDVLKKKLQEKETLYYINWTVSRIHDMARLTSDWELLNDHNKYLMGISDEDMQEFIAKTSNSTRTARERDVAGTWERITYDQQESLTLTSDHNFSLRMVRQMSLPMAVGKFTDTVSVSGTWRIRQDSLLREADVESFRVCYDRSALSCRTDMRDSVDAYFSRWYSPEMLRQVARQYYGNLQPVVVTIDQTGQNMEWQGEEGLFHYKRKHVVR